jgi:type I restriction enzyme S subunit
MKVDKSKWEVKKLQNVCSITMGQSPDSKYYNSVGEGIPFFQGNADFGAKYPIIRSYCTLPTKIAYSGDLLMSVRAPIGAINFANTKCCIGRGLCSMKANDTLSIPFLYYFLLHSNTELNNKGTGCTFKCINKRVLYDFAISVPPLPEQQAIASELDAIQSLITKYKEQLNDYDNLAKSIFNEMFGDVVSNDKGWERKKISDVCDTSAGGTPNKSVQSYYLNGNIPWLRSGEITQMIISNTEIMITKSGLDNSSAKIFPKNTIVVAMYGATAGQVGILNFECSTNQAICGILPNDNISTVFMYYVLVLMKKKLIENASGSAQPNISQQKIKSLSIILPPLPLQQKFAARITAIESQKDEVKQQIADLQTLFDSRMQYYFD